MKIDPKTITLDANERHVIHQALTMYAAAKLRTVSRYVATPSERSDRITMDADHQRARAIDLMEVMS